MAKKTPKTFSYLPVVLVLFGQEIFFLKISAIAQYSEGELNSHSAVSFQKLRYSEQSIDLKVNIFNETGFY